MTRLVTQVAMCTRTWTVLKHTYHLKCVSLALCLGNRTLQHCSLVKPEAPCQIANPWPEHGICKQVRPSRYEFPFKIPAINSTIPTISSASHNVVVAQFLFLDHWSDKFGVVREICIHDDYEGPRSVLKSMDVRSTKTKFACAGFEDDAASVKVLKLLGYLQGAVGGTIVDNDNFPVEFAERAGGVSILVREEPIRRDHVERGRYHFSANVRLRSQVTERMCQYRQLGLNLGCRTDR